MLRPRIIPCLLIQNNGLVKTVKFEKPKYVGDPINAVRIFNEKEADELMVLDIDASVMGRAPDFKLIERLAAECRMPLCYGGGVKNREQARELISLGVEKVALSSALVENPGLAADIADEIKAWWPCWTSKRKDSAKSMRYGPGKVKTTPCYAPSSFPKPSRTRASVSWSSTASTTTA
jgi:tRNA-dihydrouridine synthase